MIKPSNRLSSKSSVGTISTITLPMSNREVASVISNNRSFPRPPSIILISNNPIDVRRSVSVLRQSSNGSIASDNAKYNAWKQVNLKNIR